MSDIGWAVTQMKSGSCVRRVGWNGKNMHIYIEDGFNWSPGGGIYAGQKREYASHIILYNAQGIHQPGWNASTPDLLATDWEVAQG